MTIKHECMHGCLGACYLKEKNLKSSFEIEFGGKFNWQKYHVILLYYIQSLNSHCNQHVFRLRY